MNYKGKVEWRRLIHRWDSCNHLHLNPSIAAHERAAITTYGDVIREWVHSDRLLEMWDPAGGWVEVPFQTVTFLNPAGYRVQPQGELNMEQYSKEFWQTCIDMHPMHLSKDVGDACVQHNEWVLKWLNGEELERSEQAGEGGWEPVPKTHHRFMRQYKYRVAPKAVERYVVVFYRDSYTAGYFTAPAGIDVAILATPEQAGLSKFAKTIPMLAEKYSGFKLLSVTRVVVDLTNHSLLEYTTELANRGRVPF